MAKAVPLTLDALKAPQVTPQAATPPRSAAVAAPAAKESKPLKDNVPLQIRVPRAKAKDIKRDALELNYPSISEFMVACYDAFKAKK